jgi:hypothetical protein
MEENAIIGWKDASLGICVDIVIVVVLARVQPRLARQLAGQHAPAM